MHENCGRKQADNKQADSRRTLRVFFTQISTVGWGGDWYGSAPALSALRYIYFPHLHLHVWLIKTAETNT